MQPQSNLPLPLSIPLTGIVNGHRAVVGRFIVDATDAWAVARRWHLDATGYPCTFVVGVGCRRLHRFLMDVPSKRVVDHINRNKLDNRRANLRVVSQRVNYFNSSSVYIVNYEAGVCSHGHPKTPVNMYMRKDRPGKWNCQQCKRDRRAAQKAGTAADGERAVGTGEAGNADRPPAGYDRRGR
jgi:hypothetical protein